MGNFKVDVDYDLDFLNITLTRSQAVPKVTPAWKVRLAPKLPPKQPKALPAASVHKPPPRPKINATRTSNASPDKGTPRVREIEDSKEAGGRSTSANSVPKASKVAPKGKSPNLKDTKSKASQVNGAK